MPVHQTQTKIVPIVQPQVITDDGDPVGAYGGTSPIGVNTLGFSRCDIYLMVGATDIAVAALGVYSGSAATPNGSNYTAVTGLQASGATGDGRLPAADDDNKVFHFGIDLRNDDVSQYLALDVTAGNGSAGTYFAAFAVLSNAEESPNSDTEKGIAWGLEI